MIFFNSNAAVKLKKVKDDEKTDDMDISIAKVAKQVVNECKSIIYDKPTYPVHIDPNVAFVFWVWVCLRYIIDTYKCTLTNIGQSFASIIDWKNYYKCDKLSLNSSSSSTANAMQGFKDNRLS